MPEALSKAGVSWKVYTSPALGDTDNVLSFFKSFKTESSLKALGLEPTYPEDFESDLKHGELPQVSWVLTSALETEHPGNSTAKVGEHAVQLLLDTLLKHKSTWEKAALFITWDENGGFFDHLPPPVPPAETPDEFLTVEDITKNSEGIKGPIGLGFRVPLLIVSPFSQGGFLSKETADHTSLLRFLETRFKVEVPNLSKWRRANTGDLTKSFNFVEPITKKAKIKKVKLSKNESKDGGCSMKAPVTVPPNSTPEQGSHEWRKPSG